MIARAAIALAFLAFAVRAQDSLWVDVMPTVSPDDETEKRYTPELVKDLDRTKANALLLYTEYSGRIGSDMKNFLKNMSKFANETLSGLDRRVLYNARESCRRSLEDRLKKIEFNAHRAASFSGENHHKFLLGHMIVFRMHLNKSEDYINKCDRVIQGCGISCETTPRIRRWRRLASEELHRVKDDIQHSRRSYRDLIAHAHRRLNHLKRQANTRAIEAVEQFYVCANKG